MAAQEREERSQERAAGRGRHGGCRGGRSSAISYAGLVRRSYQQGGTRSQRIRYQYEYGPRGQTSYNNYSRPSNYEHSYGTPVRFSVHGSPRYFGRFSGRYGTPGRYGPPGRYSGRGMTPRNLEPGMTPRILEPGMTPRNLEPRPRQGPSGCFITRVERVGRQGGRSSGRGRHMYYHQQHVEYYSQETDEAPYGEYAEEPQEEQPWSDQYYVPEEPNYGEYKQEYEEYGNY